MYLLENTFYWTFILQKEFKDAVYTLPSTHNARRNGNILKYSFITPDKQTDTTCMPLKIKISFEQNYFPLLLVNYKQPYRKQLYVYVMSQFKTYS